ncbi:MAG: ScpA family protein, partial [Vicinamibacterales bacterium]
TDEPFEPQLDAIQIKLQSFEGPLDLLVHLIRKNRLDVYEIPIALITEQYLQYLDLMQELNLDVASEFLVMAATLIHIKSRMLLPRPDPAQGDDGGAEDPRDALVRRLLEHQKFKAAAELLHDRETLRSAQWTRPDARVEEIAGDAYEPELEVDLFSLLTAFRGVLERARERPPLLLPPEQISVEARIEQLLERLSETEACGFEDLFVDAAAHADLIVTFLALLEMIRLKLVRVFQSGHVGAIRIYKRARPQDAPHPIHDPEDEYKAHHPAPARCVTDARHPPEHRDRHPPGPIDDDHAPPPGSGRPEPGRRSEEDDDPEAPKGRS